MRRVLIASLLLLSAGIWLAWALKAEPAPFEPAPRTEAAGDLSALPADQRVLFGPDDFRWLEPPGPSDWLANHPEPGQTFDQYAGSGFNRPTPERRTIVLQPIGAFADDPAAAPALADLKECAGAYFGLPVEVQPAMELDLARWTHRTHPGTSRRQFLTGDLLDMLAGRLPAHAYCILGVTMEDLYPDPDWNFVFGSASLRARTGVFSFARYDPRFFGEPRGPAQAQTLLRRSCKVLTHETGHMFGLIHCVHYACGMNGSNHMAESDSRPIHLCPVCLRKLMHAVGFDPWARYRALEAFYRRVGLQPEAAWVARRLTRRAL